MPPLMCAVGRVPGGDPAPRPGDPSDGRQNEDARGTTPGLPEAHRRAQGVALRQGGTLQHVADRCRRVATTARREESTYREEDAAISAGSWTSWG